MRVPNTMYQGFVGDHYEKVYTGMIMAKDRDMLFTLLMMGKGEVYRYDLEELLYKSETSEVFLKTYSSGHKLFLIGSISETGSSFRVTQRIIKGDGKAFLDGTQSTQFAQSVEIKYDAFCFKNLNVEMVVSTPYTLCDGTQGCLVEIRFCSKDDKFEEKNISLFIDSLLPFTGFKLERNLILSRRG